MPNYQVRAYGPNGEFAFGATLRCRDGAAATDKFNSLPLTVHRAELLCGKRKVAVREAPNRELKQA